MCAAVRRPAAANCCPPALLGWTRQRGNVSAVAADIEHETAPRAGISSICYASSAMCSASLWAEGGPRPLIVATGRTSQIFAAQDVAPHAKSLGFPPCGLRTTNAQSASSGQANLARPASAIIVGYHRGAVFVVFISLSSCLLQADHEWHEIRSEL